MVTNRYENQVWSSIQDHLHDKKFTGSNHVYLLVPIKVHYGTMSIYWLKTQVHCGIMYLLVQIKVHYGTMSIYWFKSQVHCGIMYLLVQMKVHYGDNVNLLVQIKVHYGTICTYPIITMCVIIHQLDVFWWQGWWFFFNYLGDVFTQPWK